MSDNITTRRIHSDAVGAVEEMDVDDKDLKQSMKDAVTESMPGQNKAAPFVNRPRPQVGQTRRNPQVISSSSSINIVGGTIKNAAIGNTGPTVFSTKNQVFQKGSANQSVNISGGDFSQANILGVATYNNKGSAVGGGGDGFPSLTAELLTLSILENGVTTADLASLLEKQYSLVNIAFAIPEDGARRRRMIDALLLD